MKRYQVSAKGKYVQQKINARRRGIPWEFTFETWWAMWESSGKWESRGDKKGHYQMGRNGDEGPYSPTNCRILKLEVNVYERNYKYGPPGNPHAPAQHQPGELQDVPDVPF